MNLAFFLHPKSEVSYLYDDNTLRRALEILRKSGYTAIPVLQRDGSYAGTLSEGDLLWYLSSGISKVPGTAGDPADVDAVTVSELHRAERNPPVLITADLSEVLSRAENQNFIPVTDDRGMFIGIVTRKDIIHYYTAAALPD